MAKRTGDLACLTGCAVPMIPMGRKSPGLLLISHGYPAYGKVCEQRKHSSKTPRRTEMRG